MKVKANSGTVFLIGAGPGDPELLTLKAVKAIRRCDVLLVDDLVDRAVLEHAKPNARVINVGKRGGCKSTPQQFIERMMIRFARAGATVGRIKGGDPFVFGRGGEEMLALRDAGINVTVVPGVTAGCAAPGALHIPVTHRDFSRGVTFITGHTKTDAALNYSALAHSGTTLVIYMGITNLGEIAEGLIVAGMSRNTPACAIRNGTWQDQISVIATLETLALDVAQAKLTSPAIIVIGEVVSLAKRDNKTAIVEETRCAA
jgi:uroporphyrin-III C-methyltransferase